MKCRKSYKEKNEIYQWLPFLGRKREVPLPEKFGKVVAALVAGNRLPPIYPEMTMGALGGWVGEDGETIKNLATK